MLKLNFLSEAFETCIYNKKCTEYYSIFLVRIKLLIKYYIKAKRLDLLVMNSSASKNTANLIGEKLTVIPKTVTLSWKSITVKAPTGGALINFFAKCNNNSPNLKTILHNADGIVEPGQMLALMGSRYTFFFIIYSAI